VVIGGGPNRAQQIQDGGRPPFKKPYVCNDFTDVDEIWHGDACWPRTADMSLKYQFFGKSKMAVAAILKNHNNRDISAMV